MRLSLVVISVHGHQSFLRLRQARVVGSHRVMLSYACIRNSSSHSVSHGLLLGLPLVSEKREPLTNDSPLCIRRQPGPPQLAVLRAASSAGPSGVCAPS